MTESRSCRRRMKLKVGNCVDKEILEERQRKGCLGNGNAGAKKSSKEGTPKIQTLLILGLPGRREPTGL